MACVLKMFLLCWRWVTNVVSDESFSFQATECHFNFNIISECCLKLVFSTDSQTSIPWKILEGSIHSRRILLILFHYHTVMIMKDLTTKKQFILLYENRKSIKNTL